jgi:hypothetical protein
VVGIYKSTVAGLESGAGPNAATARNPYSSAYGTYQFVDDTWEDIVARSGISGLPPKAEDATAEQTELAMDWFTEQNRSSLRDRLGREPADDELYLAHHFGAKGGARLINASADQTIDKLFPQKVLDANPNLPKTVGELRAKYAKEFGTPVQNAGVQNAGVQNAGVLSPGAPQMTPEQTLIDRINRANIEKGLPPLAGGTVGLPGGQPPPPGSYDEQPVLAAQNGNPQVVPNVQPQAPAPVLAARPPGVGGGPGVSGPPPYEPVGMPYPPTAPPTPVLAGGGVPGLGDPVKPTQEEVGEDLGWWQKADRWLSSPKGNAMLFGLSRGLLEGRDVPDAASRALGYIDEGYQRVRAEDQVERRTRVSERGAKPTYKSVSNILREDGSRLGAGRFNPDTGNLEYKVGGQWQVAPEGSYSASRNDRMNPNQFRDFNQDISTRSTGLYKLQEYSETLQDFDQGASGMFDYLKGRWRTLMSQSNLTPSQLKGEEGRALAQGLLGRFKDQIVGPGILTEKDAERVIQAIGGEPGFFQNKEVAVNLLRGLWVDAAQEYNDTLPLYNAQAEMFNMPKRKPIDLSQFKRGGFKAPAMRPDSGRRSAGSRDLLADADEIYRRSLPGAGQ